MVRLLEYEFQIALDEGEVMEETLTVTFPNTAVLTKENENVRIYFCPGSSEEMGHFRKTGTRVMQGKPYTWRRKIQLYVADAKERGKAN